MFQDKKVIHLVARGLGGEIGADNKLLWHIPEDLKFFKDSTIGHVVLMGRNTVESLPKKLPRRVCMCVSSKYSANHPTWLLAEALVDANAYSNVLNTDKIFIAGGAQMYNSTFDIVDELWVTQVLNEYPEADIYYNTPLNFELYSESEPISCLDRISGECVNIKFQKWRRK